MNRRKLKRTRDLILRYHTLILGVVSVILFSLSFVQYHSNSIERETRTVQRKLVSRLKTLDKYAKQAFAVPADQWLELNGFPEDMVIYRYNADTLQSWKNLFPISNDEVDVVPLWYRIFDINTQNFFNTPLSFLSGNEQYVNLGSSWYVVKVYTHRNMKVIAGLLVKTEYISENAVLKNTVNKKLGLGNGYTVVSINADDSNIVKGREGEALFSVISSMPVPLEAKNSGLRWVSILVLIFAIFSYHDQRRDKKSFIFSFVMLLILRGATMVLARNLEFTTELFSPNLYADSTYFNSLGGFLINHLFVFLCVLAIFMIRDVIYGSISKSGFWPYRVLKWSLVLLPILLIVYIHLTLRSLILNSNIVLELYRIEEISSYSLLVYFSYALMFLSILLCLQMIFHIFGRGKWKEFSLFGLKPMAVYILVISFYTIVTVSYFGFQRELEKDRVLTTKLAINRDLSLELQLRSIENQIISDPMICLMIDAPRGDEMIRSRLSELYLWNISQKYDIRITVCAERDKLLTENYPYPVDCYDFFKTEIIDKYGIPLSGSSPFYYINNFKSGVSYLGVFNFITRNGRYKLFLEFDSKPINEAIGYPSLLIDSKMIAANNIPNYYSYAKYYDRKLISFRGRYNYPIYSEMDLPEGTSYQTIGNYFHFFNKISGENVIVLSRPSRNIFPYVISYSYLGLFFCLILFSFTQIRKKGKEEMFFLPKKSFRKKITYLLTISLVVALICMGVGSVLFTINLINEDNRIQMEEKLQSVQTTFNGICKYAQKYNDINTLEMFNSMDGVATNTRVDINLYDPHGRLIRSTKPEVFNQYLMSSRMDPDAYYDLIYLNKRQVIQQESIASLNYYSLYAPIFNSAGNLITIVNIPYFLNTTDFYEDASSIIATIVNIYLLLLLAALLVGTTISNSLTRPLAELGAKMRRMDISKKAEHLKYDNKDELGALVKAYNKMIDDLEASTRQLAQSEREQAWREMARQIAHEIKNPLTPMRLSIQHLVRLKKQNVPDWQDKFDALSVSLLEQIDILSDTATEFSSFAKFFNEDNIVFDLVPLIEEQIVLFDNRENVRISFYPLYDGEANVFAKKSQLARAFVNLISNAIQAVESQAEGRIIITLSEEKAFFSVSVEDNGPGVSEENLQKLFKPNFTTKSAGTGLGLAICKSILDQSQGTISYSTSKMGGACFTIKLPIIRP